MYAVDTRPRIKYAYPDGRVGIHIIDHGDVPTRVIDLELAPNDPLWPTAQRRPGTDRRFTILTLAEGL